MPRLPPEPLEPAKARKRALIALGRREYSAHELAEKLGALGVETAEASQIVQDLKDRGWQDDVRYGDLVTRSRVAQGYGPIRIQAELAARGLDDATIRKCLEAIECDWDELALATRHKRFGAGPADFSGVRKQWAFLAGRGFSTEQIRRALADSPDE